MEPTVALVPLRSLGKTRLAPHLDADQRSRLAGAMLSDVARALAEAPVDRVVVAAGGDTAAAVAADLDLEVVLDPPGGAGLDAAVAAAVPRLGAIGRLLVVAADLPGLTARDVAAVLDSDAEVVVAPTGDGGTGGLARTPPEAIASAYGPGSARRHVEIAERSGLGVEVVRRPGFAADVDTIDDLVALPGGRTGPATAAWLTAAGLARAG